MCRFGDQAAPHRASEQGRRFGEQRHILLGELWPACSSHDDQCTPHRGVDHERGAELWSDTGRRQQIAVSGAGLGMPACCREQGGRWAATGGEVGELVDVVGCVLVVGQHGEPVGNVLEMMLSDQPGAGIEGVPARPVERDGTLEPLSGFVEECDAIRSVQRDPTHVRQRTLVRPWIVEFGVHPLAVVDDRTPKDWGW